MDWNEPSKCARRKELCEFIMNGEDHSDWIIEDIPSYLHRLPISIPIGTTRTGIIIEAYFNIATCEQIAQEEGSSPIPDYIFTIRPTSFDNDSWRRRIGRAMQPGEIQITVNEDGMLNSVELRKTPPEKELITPQKVFVSISLLPGVDQDDLLDTSLPLAQRSAVAEMADSLISEIKQRGRLHHISDLDLAQSQGAFASLVKQGSEGRRF